MLIISGRINNFIPEVAPAINSHDRDALLEIAGEQYRLGADAFDVTCSADHDSELDNTCWVIETLVSEFDARISVDSTRADVQEAALPLIKGTVPIINSTSLEKKRIESLVPLAKKYDTELVVLLHDERGMPGTTQQRLNRGDTDMPDPLSDRLSLLPEVEKIVSDYGLDRSRIYIDPLVFPMSTDTRHWISFMKTVTNIREHYPGYHISGGIDNGSFGLPNPELLNIAMTDMHFGAGGDTVMIQLTPAISAHIHAVRLLLNEDRGCKKYTRAFKNGLL